MKIIFKIGILVCLAASFVLPVAAQTAGSDSVVFRAIEDEMSRSLKDLKWKTFDKPYFLEYVVEDVDSLAIQATFGALMNSRRNRSRLLFTQVRVGSYELDSRASFPFPLPLDDDYNALRRAVWFSTDASYKRAVNMFETIKAAKKRFDDEDSDEEKIASFSKEKPVVSLEKPGKLEVDKEKWEKRVKKWSAMFRDYPQFRDSTFNFYVRQTNRYLVNSEGTKVLKPRLLLTVDIHASAVTAKRASIAPYRHIFATSFDELPTVEKINEEIKGLAKDVKTYENAKEFKDTYLGPAIFTKGASVQLFLQKLVPSLRSRGGGSGLAAARRAISGIGGGGFSDRIGRRVLPKFLSVIDDPTLKEYKGKELSGGYKIDEEGVVAKPLTLIKDGTLKTLLSTRNPSKGIKTSNGRARGSGTEISNLIVKSSEGKSFAELKQQLIEECKDQGLPYGIIFRENNSTFSTFSGAGSVLAYKVYVDDGREELYRGASIRDLSTRELRRILAAGNDSFVYNLLNNSSYNGTGTPTSISAPSVLLEEINLGKSRSVKVKPRLVTHPFFNK